MNGVTYYLSSLESSRFAPVRECRVERLLTFDTGKPADQVRLLPGVVGQDFDRGADVDTVVLAARHEGVSVDAVTEFPCFVFIVIPRPDTGVIETPLRRRPRGHRLGRALPDGRGRSAPCVRVAGRTNPAVRGVTGWEGSHG
jgi:hypothetical protein